MRSLLALLLLLMGLNALSQDYYLFVGTYTSGKSKGIYVFRFNAANGEAQWVSSTDSCTNPSYLAIAPNGKYLYAVNETGGDKPGRVSAYAFDAATGQLQFQNTQASGGDHPCFVTIDKTGKWVVVGNYTGGNLSAFPVNTDGSLQPSAQLMQHYGRSVNNSRQDKPHVHATFFSPDNKWILAPDLGTDKVMLYNFDGLKKKPLQPAKQVFASSAPGSGPRHLAFHPNGRFVYVLEELSGTVKSYRYQQGNMTGIQLIPTHPIDFKGQPGSADIHLTPDGKFLYASNRGEENNLAIFAVDAVTGLLTAKGYQPLPGKGPRNFIIEPSGNYLLVANQLTNNIVIYKINTTTGQLQPTLHQLEVPNPVCLQLLKMDASF